VFWSSPESPLLPLGLSLLIKCWVPLLQVMTHIGCVMPTFTTNGKWFCTLSYCHHHCAPSSPWVFSGHQPHLNKTKFNMSTLFSFLLNKFSLKTVCMVSFIWPGVLFPAEQILEVSALILGSLLPWDLQAFLQGMRKLTFEQTMFFDACSKLSFFGAIIRHLDLS
jgi:hypothetical protein